MSDDMKYSDDYDIGWEKWVDAYDQTLEEDDILDLDDLDDEELDPEDLEALGLEERRSCHQPIRTNRQTPALHLSVGESICAIALQMLQHLIG